MKKLVLKHFMYGWVISTLFLTILLLFNMLIDPSFTLVVSFIGYISLFIIISFVYSLLFTLLDYFTIFKKRYHDFENRKEVK